eukprot:scaffold33572_cov47-Phaeocystis_antarctica.AAC.1
MVALVRKGGDTTTRTGIETAGSRKDLGFWLWPLGAGRCKQHLTLSQGRTRHPQLLRPSSRSRAPTSGAHVLPGRPVRDQPKISADRTAWR